MVDLNLIKELREETAVSVSDCKEALEEAKGDKERAKEILKKKGLDLAGKKSSRETCQGVVASYIHPNKKVGVLLELLCETDFVAKSEDFQSLSHEICLQIAAMGREETDLLEQPWVKDVSKTVGDLVKEYIAKLGENITIKRFERYEI